MSRPLSKRGEQRPAGQRPRHRSACLASRCGPTFRRSRRHRLLHSGAASASGPPGMPSSGDPLTNPLWQSFRPWGSEHGGRPVSGLPGGAVPQARPVDEGGEVPTFTPRGIASHQQGFKVFVGDLPTWVTASDFREWMQNDPAFGVAALDGQAIMPHLVDMTVSGGARSGLTKAILVFDNPLACRAAFHALFRWWAPCPTRLESRGWRWLAVRYITH